MHVSKLGVADTFQTERITNAPLRFQRSHFFPYDVTLNLKIIISELFEETVCIRDRDQFLGRKCV